MQLITFLYPTDERWRSMQEGEDRARDEPATTPSSESLRCTGYVENPAPNNDDQPPTSISKTTSTKVRSFPLSLVFNGVTMYPPPGCRIRPLQDFRYTRGPKASTSRSAYDKLHQTSFQIEINKFLLISICSFQYVCWGVIKAFKRPHGSQTRQSTSASNPKKQNWLHQKETYYECMLEHIQLGGDIYVPTYKIQLAPIMKWKSDTIT